MRKSSLMVVLFFSVFLSGHASDFNAAKQLIQDVEQEIDASVKNWEVAKESSTWEPYALGKGLSFEKMTFRVRVTGRDVFSGLHVAENPFSIRFQLYSNGLSRVTISVDGRPLEIFQVDGSGGTGRQISKEVILGESLPDRNVEIIVDVRNQGFKPFRQEFWPPRKTELSEEGISFSIRSAVLIFPKSEALCARVQNWLTSMKTAYGLLNPELVRHTFTGKPYTIQDGRNVSPHKISQLNAEWTQAVNAFDLAALKSGNPEAVDDAITASYDRAGNLRQYAEQFKVFLIGNAHIDIAWLWRIRETVAVARNTYRTVIQNMLEYPELAYAQSQAITYDWMEKMYPELFEKIRERIQDGRWEVVGGMWVEPDCNLISGESWVRQILYGKKYFREKFNLDVRIGWNPDSFGYNWNMPQIYTKSGIDCFITQKIWWNDTTVFPHFIFWWEGVDDTRLLTYFPPMGYTSRVRLPRVVDAITKYQASTGYQKSLILYGIGDHGGGPNREILQRVRDYGKLTIHPEFIHSTSHQFLSNIQKDLQDNIPVWNDELYLEYHRGTYTTQAEIKKNNRKSESMLSAAEKIAAISSLWDHEYPQNELEEIWKIILTNQFHDILPGSCITPVVRDALEAYGNAQRRVTHVENTALDTIAKNIDTSNIMGTPLMVFNTLSWERTDFVSVTLPDSWEGHVQVFQCDGVEIPVEVVRNQAAGSVTVSFVAEKVPAMGYSIYDLRPGNPTLVETDTIIDGLTLENRFYQVSVNSRTGNITSIFDKRLNREFVEEGKEANLLQVYEDRPEHWDAWNIGATGRKWDLNEADSVTVLTRSPVRASIQVKKSFLGLSKDRYSPTEDFPSSFFTQTITLYHNMDRIDVKNNVDWWESHMFLKVAFPVRVQNQIAVYEIPFAAIKRTTKNDTLWEKARFEVPALKWADLSDENGGISILNDSKYGYDIHSNVMKLSLLRAPTWPDPMADRGKHEFVYALHTHQGQWNDGDTVRRGYELNTPLRVVILQKHNGNLPSRKSFFSVKSSGVILDTVKKAVNDTDLVFRLYESKGTAEQASLRFYRKPARIVETDLMENTIRKLPVHGKELTLNFKKFEIKTIKVAFE